MRGLALRDVSYLDMVFSAFGFVTRSNSSAVDLRYKYLHQMCIHPLRCPLLAQFSLSYRQVQTTSPVHRQTQLNPGSATIQNNGGCSKSLPLFLGYVAICAYTYPLHSPSTSGSHDYSLDMRCFRIDALRVFPRFSPPLRLSSFFLSAHNTPLPHRISLHPPRNLHPSRLLPHSR